MKACIRCGGTENLDRHHIIQREDRCQPCHKYEHVRRQVLAALEYEQQRGQADRMAVFQRRLDVLDANNTPERIRFRGSYLTYWGDSATHVLPRRIPTPKEAILDAQIDLWMSQAQASD